MKKLHLELLLTLLLIGAVACSPKSRERGKPSESGELRPESAHMGASPATTSAPSTGGLNFTPASGWISETPSSGSRKAQYRLPRVVGDPEDAELIVYYFSGGGGTPQANVDRWIGQFAGPDGKPPSGSAKVTHKTVNNIPVTVVDVSGTYSSSMGGMQQGGQPEPGVRMLGAIAETNNGPWFIKLTGPLRTVAKWQSSFDSFLNSMKQN